MTYQSQEMSAVTGATLGDVLAWAEASGEGYDAIRELEKIPARLGHEDHDIGLLPADLRHFEKIVAPSPYGMVSKAADLEAARRRGNARVRALLRRFCEATAGAAPRQGRELWDALIAIVAENEGFTERGALFPTGKARALYALRARCRMRPCDLTQAEIDRICAEATAGARKSIRKGLKLLNDLIIMHDRLPGIAEMLPQAQLSMPVSPDRAARILWASLPRGLREDAEQVFRATLSRPQDRAADAKRRLDAGEDPERVLAEINDMSRLRRRSPKNSSAAVTGYRSAVAWLYRAAQGRDPAAGSAGGLAELMTRDAIDAACADQIARSVASLTLKDPKSSQTLSGRLTGLRTIANHGLKRPDIVALIDLARITNHDCIVEPGRDLTEEADYVCRMLRDNPDLAARYVQAPGILAGVAVERLADARTRSDLSAEDAALRLYCAAAFHAVQLSRPLRTSNLIRLRCTGAPEAPANIHWVRKGSHAELRFRPGEIKNEHAVNVHVLGEDAGILRIWLSELRPRFLKLRGLDDSPYVLPGVAAPRHVKDAIRLPAGCVSPSTFAELWVLGDAVLGLGLTPHRCRHATATLILAMEPGAFAKVGSVIGDTEETARKHYGRDSGEQAAVSVRQALLARHPALFRKMKGRFG